MPLAKSLRNHASGRISVVVDIIGHCHRFKAEHLQQFSHHQLRGLVKMAGLSPAGNRQELIKVRAGQGFLLCSHPTGCALPPPISRPSHARLLTISRRPVSPAPLFDCSLSLSAAERVGRAEPHRDGRPRPVEPDHPNRRLQGQGQRWLGRWQRAVGILYPTDRACPADQPVIAGSCGVAMRRFVKDDTPIVPNVF